MFSVVRGLQYSCLGCFSVVRVCCAVVRVVQCLLGVVAVQLVRVFHVCSVVAVCSV